MAYLKWPNMCFPPINLWAMPNQPVVLPNMTNCSTCRFQNDDAEDEDSPCNRCYTTSGSVAKRWQPKVLTEIPITTYIPTAVTTMPNMKDDGKTTACYDIPENAKTLDDLIEHKNMPFWLGTIFKVCYAFEERSTRNAAASQLRELNKIGYYQKRGLDILTKEE